MEPLRVLELYSGIGGMHFALKGCGVPAQVVAAVDINTTANHIYKHNFPSTPMWSKSIEGIPLEDFNKLSIDMILMSPPCQPFTRLGLKRDVVDQRTKSFLYVLDLLPKLSPPPRYILLENVKGFEESCARNQLVKTLNECGYHFKEIMVSPTSVGIPNSRLRYFLMAKRSEEGFSTETHSQILEAFPLHMDLDVSEQPTVLTPFQPETEVEQGQVLYKLETPEEVQRKQKQNSDPSIRQIQDFLDPDLDLDMDQYLLPPKTLLRYANILDIVWPSCRRSICFTKGYGRYVEGTGSVLQSSSEAEVEQVYQGLEELSEEQRLRRLHTLRLRYFSPREVANIMGFPQSFAFPEDVPVKQRYKVLGNSLNVEVVCKLLQILLSQHTVL
ncbi:tRNA (cytosine(38)-C(5))-methyltransferase isoform X1 [Periophthalmus magnuspinnatus]|uniref:tRNA (cytosine(38)-C(5))-methyltransferase isoform X1 n=1 Tax=Periophthalmus magnuspinnatus TaxID=409849 RepID=UPI0024370ECF|nr:tRNA (cytosine(38)-C(5))-methyltransferase isoform X1 [Periophthalmus magnuspinnatus]